jgi:hypothetical protein
MIVNLPLLVFCQSFITCPDIETPERKGFDDVKISIVFDDSRTYEKKRKEQCKKDEIFEEFVNCVKRTYPNMQITVLNEKTFYENPLKGVITIKVKFKKYDVTFYTGMWVSNTTYEVKIFDERNNENIIEENITGEAKQFNALPNSHKKASNKSFKEAFDKFILMLEKLK